MVSRSKYPDVRIPEDETVPTYVLQNAAKRFADKVALIDAVSGESITYGSLVSGVRRVASGLARRGLRQAPGAHLDTAPPEGHHPSPRAPVVCIFAANNIYYPVVVHAVLALGGVVTAADPTSTPEELQAQLAVSGAQYVIADRSRLADTEAATRLWPVKQVFLFDESNSGHVSVVDLLADDGRGLPSDIVIRPSETIAIVPFIADRDGWTKGVLHTHKTFNANVAIMSSPSISPASSPDVMLSCLPMGSSQGLISYCGWALREGVTQIVMPKYSNGAVLSAVEKFKVTVAHAMPAVAEYLAVSPDIHRAQISSLRRLYAGGAPVREGVVGKMMARTSITEYREGLHLPEAFAIFAVPRGDTLPGYVGSVGPNTKVKVVDIFFGGCMDPEMDGEICVCGPQVALGYLTDREVDTSAIDQDGWLHTGVIGHTDRTGNFTLVGKIDDLVGYDSFQIAPCELEKLVYQLPGVSDVAIVGVIDNEGREVPRAYVTKSVDADVSESDICEYVSENVHNYQQLRGGVMFVDNLPRTSSGELQRHRIRAMARASLPNNKDEVKPPEETREVSGLTGHDNSGTAHTPDHADTQLRNGYDTDEIIMDSPVKSGKNENDLGDFLSWNVIDQANTNLSASVVTNNLGKNIRNCNDVWIATEGVSEIGVNFEPTLKTPALIYLPECLQTDRFSIGSPAPEYQQVVCQSKGTLNDVSKPYRPYDNFTVTPPGTNRVDASRNSLMRKDAEPEDKNAYNAQNKDKMQMASIPKINSVEKDLEVATKSHDPFENSHISTEGKLNVSQNRNTSVSDDDDEDVGQWEDALEDIPTLKVELDTTESGLQQVEEYGFVKKLCSESPPDSTNTAPTTINVDHKTDAHPHCLEAASDRPNGNGSGIKTKGGANGTCLRQITDPDTLIETKENGSINACTNMSS